jgi:hypothetical protein
MGNRCGLAAFCMRVSRCKSIRQLTLLNSCLGSSRVVLKMTASPAQAPDAAKIVVAHIQVHESSRLTTAFTHLFLGRYMIRPGSRAHDLHVVIKSSGHDYLGRSTAKNSLLLWTAYFTNITFTEQFFVNGSDHGPTVTVSSGVGLKTSMLRQRHKERCLWAAALPLSLRQADISKARDIPHSHPFMDSQRTTFSVRASTSFSLRLA